MKVKKHSMLFKGIVMAVAFMLTALCFPVKQLVVLADETPTDYNFLTIGDGKSEVETVVNRGAQYTIPSAYIGGNDKLKIGDESINEETDKNSDNKILTASSVKVTFNDEVDEDGKLKEIGAPDGKFVANRLGTYTITYSYTFYDASAGKTSAVTNSHQLKVKSVLSSASLDLTDPDVIFPDVIDLSVDGAKEDVEGKQKPKDVFLPNPKVKGEDGEDIPVKAYTSLEKAQQSETETSFVVVTATGGINNMTVVVSENEEDGRLYIDGSLFEPTTEEDAPSKFGAGTYTIKYSYYTRTKNGDSEWSAPYFVTSTTKSFKVYNDENNPYYKNFDEIKLELSKDWVDDGKRGEESALPTAIGVTPKDATPSGENVAVSYKVQVLFKEKYGDGDYAQITPEDYGTTTDADGKEVAILEEEDGKYYLADPTKFTPLKDGNYTFIYTITDFYGHTYSTPKGVYKFDDVKDEQEPTPVLYDASQYAGQESYEDEEHKDESYKLKTYATSNGVVVYAIGMNDNVSKSSEAVEGTLAEGEEKGKVRLTRKIMRGAETVLEINQYNKYNLVFNYRNSAAYDAYENFLTNNFLVRKAVSEDAGLAGSTVTDKIQSDTAMLKWLQEHNYLIVVDNANAEKIYEIFSGDDETLFEDIDAVKNAGSDIGDGQEEAVAEAKKDAAIAWFKTEEAVKHGFAYIDTDETFGADQADNGTGRDNYYIHYIAVDAAGNSSDKPFDISIVLQENEEQAPEVRFSTTLQKTYLPNSVVTFNVPTASDNRDANMQVVTLYRFVDSSNKPVKVEGKNTAEEAVKGISLKSLWTDINGKRVKGMLLTDTYKSYHNAEGEDGYIDLTDDDASSYTIDLKEGGNAVALQIFCYVYDDCGNVGLYAETISILNSEDNQAPKFVSAEGPTDREYSQDDEIELPTITVQDDAIGFVDYDVKLFHIKDDGTETEFNSVIDSHIISRRTWAQSKAGELKIYAGRFITSASGNYQARISIVDSKNNTIVYFADYHVKSRPWLSNIDVQATLEKNQTVELYRDTVFIPDPTVTYALENSVTYDIFKANPELYDKEHADTEQYPNSRYSSTDWVILGVDSNGRAYDYDTKNGIMGSFTPKEKTTYEIQYTVNLTAYNFKLVTYHDGTSISDGYDGGYFTYDSLPNHKIYTVDENTFKVVYTGSGDKTFTVVREGKEVKAYGADGKEIGTDAKSNYGIEDADLSEWFEQIVFTQKKGDDTYYITAQDTTAPTLKPCEYVENITIEDLKTKYDMKLEIYGIDSSDEDIDWSRSFVKVSGKLADGTNIIDRTFEGSFEKATYEFTTDKDATYTINYTVYDKTGLYTSKDYYVTVGDANPPEFRFGKNFSVKDTYKLEELKEGLIINLKDIEVYDEGVKISDENTQIDVKLYRGDDEITPEESPNPDQLTFKITQTGNYTLTFETRDAAGNKQTYEKKFTVEEKTQDTQMVYQTVGTILIVISVVVLAGVIIYFIVSKVKLDKELKK